jgi:hypothetical protein
VANDYSRKPYKARKNDGKYIFADFSAGLHLLDTPRSMGEQLYSLALKGGRNIWSENGALVPQYGFLELDRLPENERVLKVTKDSKSAATFFMVTRLGNVYLYTAAQGLKQYKTPIVSSEAITNDCLVCRSNKTMIMYDSGNLYKFGDWYANSSYVVSTSGATFGAADESYAEISVPYADKVYYWNGKNISIDNSNVAYTIVDMVDDLGNLPTAFSLNNLQPQVNWRLEGSISVTDNNNIISIDELTKTNISAGSQKTSGGTTTITHQEVEYECYTYVLNPAYNWVKITNTDYYANIDGKAYLGLCNYSGYIYIKKGTNSIYAKQDTSTEPYKYLKANNSSELRPISSVSDNTTITITGKSGDTVTGFGYSNSSTQLKPIYKTTRYSAGDFKKTTTEVITKPDVTTHNITFNLPTNSNPNQKFTTKNLSVGVYRFVIQNHPNNGTITINVYSGDTHIDGTTLSTNNLKCSYRDSESATKQLKLFVDNIPINVMEGSVTKLTVTPADVYDFQQGRLPFDNWTTGQSVSLGERALLPCTMRYVPEDSALPSVAIYPALMDVCANRLCVVNKDGTIYYSAIGLPQILNTDEIDFKEEDGAGYFKGFYEDNSKCLALDDYLDGVLITKQNGLYYLTVANEVSTQSVSATSSIGVTINKIAEIGQVYPHDHVIVREKVYAYDSNTCSIVLAAYKTVYGQIVAGKTIVPSDYLNAQDLGISTSPRNLTFNSEADCFILYYGTNNDRGIVLNNQGAIFPRECDTRFNHYINFNQGVAAITDYGLIAQDFKKGTIILNKTPIAEFEAIGLKDNRCIISTILEVTELNGIKYSVTTQNTGMSYQLITPYIDYGVDNFELPPLVYSDSSKSIINDSYELQTKWAAKKSSLTRIYAPMSGRDGISLSFEFDKNQSFCLVALRLPDFSQGE